ncbi:uncharacterized protein LOC133303206 [Gastrolobium bilobum]|uniref:uncharacterized protein LOC133303206 n=1 Tax=Gastrolobium bilobum TaxID=150636 RepID=UPI002AB1BA2A|nr:uncharacterized protein LOC133303206 [Gastrolobium bilobum]
MGVTIFSLCARIFFNLLGEVGLQTCVAADRPSPLGPQGKNRRVQKPTGSVSDFRTAIELNPTILGVDWSLQFEKDDWRIKVRAIRTWKVPNYEKKGFDDNLEMILADEHGSTIHATVRGTLQVRKKIIEGEAYFIRNFGVGLNGEGFKATRHVYKISFNLRTDVKAIVDATIPVNYVIGLLTGTSEVEEHDVFGRKAKKIMLELDNRREHYVDEVQSFLANNQASQNVIIVHLAKMKDFRGQKSITNTRYTTHLIMDSNVTKINEFEKKLGNVSADCIRGLSQLSTQSTYSFENDFLKNTERKCITDIKISTEVMTCIAYGTIKAIESKYNWWYKSYKKCPYYVFEDYEKWFCKNCQKHWSDYQPRFSVQVRVVDNTDSASFILFDRDCVTLLGMSASDLRELQYKSGADLEHYPKEFDVLVDKSMLFKINVRKNNFDSYSEPKYQVSKVCTDETIMSSFIKSATELNDETLFDQAFDNDIVAAENGRAADVASQTCESADPVNDSLSMMTPSVNSNEFIDEIANEDNVAD